MESVGKVIYNVFSGDATITGLVGTRFYQGLIPQDDTSDLRIRYYTTGVIPNDTKDGASILDEVSVRVDCFGKNQNDTESLAQAVRSALDYLPRGTYNGIAVQGCRFASAVMLPEAADLTEYYCFSLYFEFRIDRLNSV